MEQSSKCTPSVSIKQDTAALRNVRNSTIATMGTVDSKKSLDTKVSTETPQTTSSLPAECKKPPEGNTYYSVVNDEEALQEFMSAVDKVDEYEVDIFADTEGEDGLGKDFNPNGITIKMVLDIANDIAVFQTLPKTLEALKKKAVSYSPFRAGGLEEDNLNE